MDRRQDKLLKQLTEAYEQMNAPEVTEDVASDVYDADIFQGQRGIGKVFTWLGNKLDRLFDGPRQKGSPNRSGSVIRKQLERKYSSEVIEKIEKVYRDAVIEAMNEEAIGDYVSVNAGSGNFGDIIFRDEVFSLFPSEMEAVEQAVREKLNSIES